MNSSTGEGMNLSLCDPDAVKWHTFSRLKILVQGLVLARTGAVFRSEKPRFQDETKFTAAVKKIPKFMLDRNR
jgi:hypothetical protein